MNKEEYYKRLEKTTEKIKTDRCSEDEIANINRQKLYLAEHYITGLEQENKQLKDNWNKLKEIAKSQIGFKKRADLKGGLWFEIDELMDKMQELDGSNDILKGVNNE